VKHFCLGMLFLCLSIGLALFLLMQTLPDKGIQVEVRSGWSLNEIAEGVGMDLTRLKKLNGLDSNEIYPGQLLKVKPYTFFNSVLVSWYGEKFHGRRMSNGEPFDMNDDSTCAHKWLPFGTRLRLTRIDTGESIIVTVRDRGPYIEGRHVDLSKAAAIKLGMLDDGVVECQIEVLTGFWAWIDSLIHR